MLKKSQASRLMLFQSVLSFSHLSDSPELWTNQHDLFLYILIRRGATIEVISFELLINFPYIFNFYHPVHITRLVAVIDFWRSPNAPPREIFFEGQAGEDAKKAWLNSR